MQAALDALFDDDPSRAGPALSRLTERERAEALALAATARLTRTALHAPDPPPPAEDASLRRAEAVLRDRPTAPPRPSENGGGWLARLLSRFRR